ncbi:MULTISPECIES: serine/threonine-protein kinase [unclassified Cryobacterium]|uniref:serine/threonine-protein kinase n=1 Tax=unclassified Cryobacterium TaxID=2649013 RepID=UPI002AB5D474|nr:MULTISPECIES: serine/threonine-protein kinase [unclassified Cryobacterium]MDY7528153.1 serine/threonine-protein kinase [Cryobacterium sp. 10C2]MDY7556098.1 serine/threonine-protein kinase [Cryobacterium sp. 10C3]MEB0289348.1 serine/threonine-protein kinase [Cryobacterium sp. 10C2]
MAIPDGYDLGERISETPAAQVWTSQSTSGRTVVLKIAADVPQVQERFERELFAMVATANRHVMPILDYDSSHSWYTMPYASHALSEADVPCSVIECVEILEAVAGGLRPLHAEGQVHRDLKPQNILWLDGDDGARWVVADFGIVRNPLGLTISKLTQSGGLTGSAGWAAPEQYSDAHDATITADVYSLGAIASWLLTGQPPSYGHVSVPPDPRLGAAIRRATRPHGPDRFANLDAFVRAFTKATHPFVGTFDALIQQGEWAEVSAYILGQPGEQTRVIRALPRASQSDVNAWAAADSAGMVDAVSDLLGEVPGMRYSDMDPFLSWCVRVVRALVNANQFELAEQVAAVLFGTTASVDQFAPSRTILDWLAVLPARAGKAMERALHSSESWEFFQEKARDKYEKYTDTELIAKLRQS